jgi:uncharacterized protein YbjT (DUF2867 family)
MSSVLIVGATGRLGKALTAELLGRGHKVLAGYRSSRVAEELRTMGAELVPLDLRRPQGFAAALDGAGQVVTAAHGLTARAADSIARVDVEGHKALIAAAERQGVRRFIYTSAQGAGPDHPASFLRAKAQVERALAASALNWTIVRPTAFMDLYAHELIGKRVLAGKPAMLLGRGNQRRNLVAVADVATAIARIADQDGFSHRTIEIGGPDNLTDREVATLYGQLSGKPVRIRSLPAPVVRLLASIIRPVHSGVTNILRFSQQVDGGEPLTFDASAMPELLGRDPTNLESFARARMNA